MSGSFAPKRSKPRPTGPTPAVVHQVIERDNGVCAVCGLVAGGVRGWDWSVQHRLRRGDGGTRRAFINLPGNLIVLHGSGASRCHGRVESERTWAQTYGYRVVDGITLPAEVAVWHLGHGGWTYLADDGTYEVKP